MFCFECGKEISDSANVCPYCGIPQREGVQLPQAQQYQQPVQQPQQASGFMDRLTGGDFMKNYKITTLVAAGLNVLLLILYFVPIFKLDASSTIGGLSGLEFSFAEYLSNSAKQQNADGIGVGMNFFMVVFAIISVITIVLPLVKKDFAKTRKFIFSKICAVLYGGLVLIELNDINSQLSKNVFTSSISLGLNFWGVLYMISAIGVIVATILMTMQMKKNNSFAAGGF